MIGCAQGKEKIESLIVTGNLKRKFYTLMKNAHHQKYKMIGKIEKIDELIKYFAIEYKFSNSIEKILTTDSHKIKNLSEGYQEKIRRRYSKDYKYFNY